MTTAIICGAGIVSGKEIMALELGEGLRAAGRPVVYVTSSWGNGDFSRRLRALELPFYRMRLGFISAALSLDSLRMTTDQMLHWPKLMYDYRRFLTRERPRNVIHTNWHHVLLLWPFLRADRDIFWLHDIVPDKPQYIRLFGELARRMNCFVAVSQSVALSLQRICIPKDKIIVIHNGIRDPSIATYAPRPQNPLINIGIVGQVGSWKGHEDLLEAFAAISSNRASARLHIFGEAEREFASALKLQAKAAGIGDNFVWHGFVSKRASIYSAMDICVVPSRFDESFGLVALEAAFFGLPVVATRAGGLTEIVNDGETGFLVERQSVKQLADRLERLLQSKQLRTRMGTAARERAVRYFSRDRFIADFLQLLPSTGSSGSEALNGPDHRTGRCRPISPRRDLRAGLELRK